MWLPKCFRNDTLPDVTRTAFRGDQHDGYRILGEGADSRVFVDEGYSSVIKWYVYLQKAVGRRKAYDMLSQYLDDSSEVFQRHSSTVFDVPMPDGGVKRAILHILDQGDMVLSDDDVLCLSDQKFVSGRNFNDLYYQGADHPTLNEYRGNTNAFHQIRDTLRSISGDVCSCVQSNLAITPLNTIPQFEDSGDLHCYVTDTCDNLRKVYQDL